MKEMGGSYFHYGFALAFEILEHVIGGLLHEKDLASALQEILSTGRDELLARTLAMLFVCVPFFAFGEVARVLGEGQVGKFFRQRP